MKRYNEQPDNSVWSWLAPDRKHAEGALMVRPLPGSLMAKLAAMTPEETDEYLGRNRKATKRRK